jgi:hypothetical protein
MFKIKNFTYVLLCAFASVCSIKASQAPAYDASLSAKEKYHILLVSKRKELYIDDRWPQFDATLSPERMYETGQEMMNLWGLYPQGPGGENELINYLAALRLRYIHESAERGYPYAIEWCTRDAYRQVCACLEQISASRIERLTAQANAISDGDVKESCDNFLRQIRESGRIITESRQSE